ncbi:MAG: bifunctional (p)ppGpp synthetase/guanosine-3',5'-bis(diphosphate) 3'-pyrophosphohydrolase [Treponema sp.]|nr:bifunctional (p)ppGpp synthetase/guanosine-3',5'-bis(diphosphate) 3'-pyrophosphohydrolase [Treponema sp.]
MSKVTVFKSDESNTEDLITEFFSINDYFGKSEQESIKKAWELLIKKSERVESAYDNPYYLHPLRVAHILAQNKMDVETIIAALLHPFDILTLSIDEIKNLFGEKTSKLILISNKILNLPINSKTLQQSDAIRKMFFALVDDVRVILIAIADRTDRIRNISGVEKSKQKIIAEEIIDIWAPLADRLGMQTEKNELEDLSLKYTNPAVFKQIKDIVAQKKDERSAYLEKAVNSIYKSAEKVGISVTIQSRAKHFYSIYQKMRKRNKEASELFDLLALRVLCQTSADCYTILGIVHSLWKPLDGRFKDYIAMPKANGYQSLHTTVMCDDKPLEIQIRTVEMHNMAEHGIASHWLYKKGTNKDLVEVDKLAIFNKFQQLKETTFADNTDFATLKNELLGDEIYVFTPKGDVIKLPFGANAIDFAYAIHSAIGEKIVAAKANGKIIPLTKPLENTQIIEVITNPQAHPTEAQLKAVKTTKAHQKIHVWLATNEPSFSDRVEAKEKSEEKNHDGELKSNNQDLNSVNAKKQKKKHSKAGTHPELANVEIIPQKGVLIQGQKNVLYNLAQCCKPHYPQVIAGYVTRMRGVTIHRADCLIYQRIPHKDQRNVEVSWDN